MKLLNKILRHRFGPVALQLILIAAASFITRIVLLVKAWPQMHVTVLEFAGIFMVGLFYDLISGLYFSVPLVLYCWLMPDKWYRRKWNGILLGIYFFIVIYILLFNAVAEYFFWDEFSVRYNFIAVDYLIYTNEVVGNIRQSYPMPAILISLLVAAILVFSVTRKYIRLSMQQLFRFRKRWPVGLSLLALPALAFFAVNDSGRKIGDDRYANELAGNGLYQFGSAFRKNELDYNEFYATRDENKSFNELRTLLKTPEASFVSSDPHNIERKITPAGAPNKWNVVLITVESFSAEYLAYFGSKPVYYSETGHAYPQTPHMDSLIPKSIFFTHFYASGTRTVRGLEALSLAAPPTPGQSLVKRLPTRQNLFTLGEVLKEQDYDCKFIYGGNSFFDNMGDYFGSNGYKVVDKKDIPADSIHHETAWGVCDEDLFTQALKEMDKSYASGKLFFNQIMTVSHHRPYTYPAGRVPVPDRVQSSHAALTYTDYAINRFLKEAQAKPYFNNTLFVIVADHCFSSSGRTDIPVNRYHIPCWIYAPALVQPRIEDRLTAQIDLAPTILGLLNVPYTSKFYGYDMFKLEKGRERLFFVTYQNVGYLRGDKLVVLSPQKKIDMYKPDFQTGEVTKIPLEDSLVNEAISYFETASYLFKHGMYKK
jgi:phosphoglycerol transferase MdoB-like AlkP superfamily enzyme